MSFKPGIVVYMLDMFSVISSACKNGQPQKGQLWPPFLPLKPLPEKFCGLTKILHSNTLHGVLFFVYHKVIKAVCYVTTSLNL